MAIGKKGGFATVTAPNVDFGAMTERFIDKKLARDKARKDEAEAKRQSKLKAEADARKARSSELKDDWAEVKATNRSMYDVSVRKMVSKQKDLAHEYGELYKSSGNPKYKKMREDAMGVVSNVASSTEALNGLLERVAEGVTTDKYNESSLKKFDEFAKSIEEGKYRVFVGETGTPMVTFFDTDPNDDINNEKTVAFSDALREPIGASKYEKNKTTFVDRHEPDDVTTVSGLTTTQVKEMTERLEGQIGNFAERLSKNKDEFANWYINEKGEDAYFENEGNFSQDDFEDFKAYIVDDVKNAYPLFTKESRKQPSGGGRGSSDYVQGTKNVYTINQPITGTEKGLNVAKGASSLIPTQPKGKGLYRKEGGTSGRAELLKGFFYDQNGLKVVTEEIVDSSQVDGNTFTVKEDGKSFTHKTSKNEKGEDVIKRVVVGDASNPDIQAWFEVAYPNQDIGQTLLKPLFNKFVEKTRSDYGLGSDMSNEDVIRWSKTNLDTQGNKVESNNEVEIDDEL